MRQPKYYRKFDYDKGLIANKYLASLENGVSSIEEAITKTGYSIGYPGWGLLYYVMLSHLHPDEDNLIVETGTNQGASTIILAQALRDSRCRGKIFTVELDNKNYEIALSNFRKAGVADVIEAFNANSHDFLRKLAGKNYSIRIAFLDASHLYNDMLTEFEIVLPLLTPQSIVVFDNTYLIAESHEDQRVHGGLREILNRYGGNLINFEFVSWYTPGMAIWQKAPFGPCADRDNMGHPVINHSIAEAGDPAEETVTQLRELTKEVDGRIDAEEAKLLYLLARDGAGEGDIVEIGSFRGYSTIWLASGTKEKQREKIHAVDPQCTDLHGNNESIFRDNIKKAGVDDYVVPIIATSTEASKEWKRPIRLLFIDGAHDYENVRNDFQLWERHLIKEGIVAFHDCYCIFWPDVGRFLNESIFESDNYAVLGCVNTVIYARKVDRLSELEKAEKEKLMDRLLARIKAVDNFQKVKTLITEENYREAECLLENCEGHINDFITNEYRLLNLISIASCYRNIGRHDKAEKILLEVLDYKHDDNLVHKRYRVFLSLGDLYLDQKKYNDSIDNYEKVLADYTISGKEKYHALMGLGRCCASMKMYGEAEGKYMEALSINSIPVENRVRAVLEFGRCHHAQKRYDLEEREYLKALSYEGISDVSIICRFRLLNRLGNMYLSGRRYEEAEHRLKEALSLNEVPDQDRYHALLGLGRCYHDFGNYTEAEKYFDEAFVCKTITDESKFTAANGLIESCLAQGKLKRIEDICGKVLLLCGITDTQKHNLFTRVKEKIKSLSFQYGGADV